MTSQGFPAEPTLANFKLARGDQYATVQCGACSSDFNPLRIDSTPGALRLAAFECPECGVWNAIPSLIEHVR